MRVACSINCRDSGGPAGFGGFRQRAEGPGIVGMDFVEPTGRGQGESEDRPLAFEIVFAQRLDPTTG